MQMKDPKGMVREAQEYPQQIRTAIDTPLPALDGIDGDRIDKVLLLGMGGSGASGSVGVALLDRHGEVVARTTKDYAAPKWVDQRTLVVATSYSGNTEETLAALADCIGRGAPWVGIASGGDLEAAARRHGAPFVKVAGGSEPRAQFASLLGPMLRILGELGLLDGAWVEEGLESAYSACLEIAGENDPSVPEEENPSRGIANALFGRQVLVMGDAPYEPLIERIRCQLNENSKVVAFSRWLPEANHNDTVAWGADAHADQWASLWVGPFDRNGALAERAAFVRETFEQAGMPVIDMDRRVDHEIGRLVALAYLGDWVSLYLAFLNKQDPGDVAAIPTLKARTRSTGVLTAAKQRLAIE